MPVMRKLFGVECARCREAGHRCQAQIWLDEIALCLRCANDEPCIYVTAAKCAGPAIDEGDPFTIPPVTSEDRQAIQNMPRLPSIHAQWGIDEHFKLSPELRAAIIADGRKLSADQLAQKYQVSKATVQNLKSENRHKLLDRVRSRTPVNKRIGKEDVKIAPLAVLGAEMLEARYIMNTLTGGKKKI